MASPERMTVSQWLNVLQMLIRTMTVSVVRGFDPVVVERETVRLEAAVARPRVFFYGGVGMKA